MNKILRMFVLFSSVSLHLLVLMCFPASSSVYSLASVKEKHLVAVMEGTGCSCSDYACGCCVDLDIPQIKLNDSVCTNMTYVQEDEGIRFTVTLNGEVIIEDEISVRNPPPICVGVPYLKELASLCIKFYNVDIEKSQVSGCASLIAKLADEVVENITLGCFKIPLAPSHSLTFAPKSRPQELSEPALQDWDSFIKLANGKDGGQDLQMLMDLLYDFHAVVKQSNIKKTKIDAL